MKGKTYFIVGIFCLNVSLAYSVPLENDNELAVSDESRELTEDEIFAKIAALHNKLEADLKMLDETANGNKEKHEEQQKKLDEELEPLVAKFEAISKEGMEKLKEFNYPVLRENKKKLAEESRDLWQKVGELGGKFKELKDEYLKKKKDCVSKKIMEEFEENTDNDDCESQLPLLNENVNKVDEELTQALEELKAKQLQAKELYNKIEESDENMAAWATEVYTREKDDMKKLEEIRQAQIELMMKRENYKSEFEIDRKELREDAKKKMRKLLPNLTLKWVRWNTRIKVLPVNAIMGGTDIDNEKLHIARRKKLFGLDFEYGKCKEARDCYITNSYKEKGAVYVDILTGENFSWCKGTGHDIVNDEFPICRARHLESTTPGTLLPSGKCRIGFGWEIFEKEEYEVLKQGKC